MLIRSSCDAKICEHLTLLPNCFTFQCQAFISKPRIKRFHVQQSPSYKQHCYVRSGLFESRLLWLAFARTMRLVHCSTYQLNEFFGSNIPRYAILSNTSDDQEPIVAKFESKRSIASTMKRSQKIGSACQKALSNTLSWLWVDTYCIDKSSSAELSEAINSMFAWYKASAVCYAYLSDVPVATSDTIVQRRWFT